MSDGNYNPWRNSTNTSNNFSRNSNNRRNNRGPRNNEKRWSENQRKESERCKHCNGRHDGLPKCPALDREKRIPICPNCQNGHHEIAYCISPIRMVTHVGKQHWKQFVYGSDEIYECSKKKQENLKPLDTWIDKLKLDERSLKATFIKEKRTILNEHGHQLKQEITWHKTEIPRNATEVVFEERTTPNVFY